MTTPPEPPTAPIDLSQIPLGELASTMGITFVAATAKRLAATMPVAGNRQPYGILHGGASAALAETVGSVHAALAAPPDTMPVGVELSCTHHRSVADGTVTAVSTPLHSGRTMATFHIVLTDDADRAICTARLSCLYRPTARPAATGS